MNMNIRARKAIAAGIVVSLFAANLLFQQKQAEAVGLGSIIKVGSVAAAITLFGKDINNFINTLYQRHGVAAKESTKVVAILSIGKGTHLGAAQVVGPKNLVGTVHAVAQGEFEPGPLRLRALIPVASRNITKGQLKTVGGVGVSAIVDIDL